MKVRIYCLRRRLLKKIIKDAGTGCWLWTGVIDKDGYGKMHGAMAHRKFFEAFKTEIPAGLTLDHKCRTRACVNPDHLRPMPLRKNILIGNGIAALNKKKRNCKRGHPFSRKNTILNKNGSRECRTCKNLLAHRSKTVTLTVTQEAIRLA